MKTDAQLVFHSILTNILHTKELILTSDATPEMRKTHEI